MVSIFLSRGASFGASCTAEALGKEHMDRASALESSKMAAQDREAAEAAMRTCLRYEKNQPNPNCAGFKFVLVASALYRVHVD